jgi:hypothetical protein
VKNHKFGELIIRLFWYEKMPAPSEDPQLKEIGTVTVPMTSLYDEVIILFILHRGRQFKVNGLC